MSLPNNSFLELPVLVSLFAFCAFLWLGIYTNLKSDATIIRNLSSFALVSQAIFFFSTTIVTYSPSLELNHFFSRCFWWDTVLPLAAWYHLSWLIRRRAVSNEWLAQYSTLEPLSLRTIILKRQWSGGFIAIRRRIKLFFPFSVCFFYFATILCVLLGSFTNSLMAFDQTTTASGFENRFYTGGGTFYYLLLLPTVLAAAFASLNFFTAWRAEKQNHLHGIEGVDKYLLWLLAGTFLFTIASTYVTSNLGLRLNWNEIFGQLVALLGLGFIGYGLVNYNTLASAILIQRDLPYSGLSILLLNIIYITPLILLIGVNDVRSQALLFVLITFITTTHLYVDILRSIFGRLFFQPISQLSHTTLIRLWARSRIDDAPAANPAKVTIENNPIETNLEVDNSTRIIDSFPSPEKYQKWVKEAYYSFIDPDKLAKNELLKYSVLLQNKVQELIEANPHISTFEITLQAFKNLLLEGVSVLKSGNQNLPNTDPVWLKYNIVYYDCIKGYSWGKIDRRLLELTVGDKRSIEEAKTEAAILESIVRNSKNYSTYYYNRIKGLESISDNLYSQEQKEAVAMVQ